ncbi:hypothetical protein FB45DRAFT_925162 [Roridomyces roridus]|uniref:Uncharacterized protein n=1 Tax=Roridomyces roridus TaxID=1738132 RepID=A0AAD7FGS1_9AGAR|nr:hypothetical protein FB45DRAFT_925162 [Roridomyces roridus]
MNILERVLGNIPEDVNLPGGLSEEDIRRFGPPTAAIPQERVLEELQSTIDSISDFFYAESSSTSENLVQDLEQMIQQIRVSEAEEDKAQLRIENLVQDLNEIHPRLHQRLTSALQKIPADLSALDTAQTDLLSMQIESSLVKISLIRAQVSRTLYTPRMNEALSAAFKRLKEEERAMEAEERKLDMELAAYQKLLDMVDGGGGFRQVLADSAVVEKETEECRRDLRRLGWT